MARRRDERRPRSYLDLVAAAESNVQAQRELERYRAIEDAGGKAKVWWSPAHGWEVTQL